MAGKVSEEHKEERLGMVFTHNKYGEFKVIEYHSCSKVYIKFSNTGYVRTVRWHNICSGRVRDPLHPSIWGVGVVGSIKTHVLGRGLKSYVVWRNMLTRCYSKKYQQKNPTYVGCLVCNEWKYYINFKDWFDKNYVEGFELDKDIKVEGNKLYSPDTCLFVPRKENIMHSNKIKMFTTILLSPSGLETEVVNQSDFSRKNGLYQPNVSGLINGRLKQHRGWKFVRRVYSNEGISDLLDVEGLV